MGVQSILDHLACIGRFCTQGLSGPEGSHIRQILYNNEISTPNQVVNNHPFSDAIYRPEESVINTRHMHTVSSDYIRNNVLKHMGVSWSKMLELTPIATLLLVNHSKQLEAVASAMNTELRDAIDGVNTNAR